MSGWRVSRVCFSTYLSYFVKRFIATQGSVYERTKRWQDIEPLLVYQEPQHILTKEDNVVP